MEEFCRADPSKLPQGFSIRSPRLDDLEAVTHLLLACELADYGVNSYSREGMQEDIRKLWSSGGMDLEHNAWIILAPDGLCVGRANLWFSSTEPEELFASPRIHPDYWGLGLGTYLLQRAEQRARELMMTLPEEKPVYLNSWVEGVNEPACKLLERKGFSALRYYWRMEIELQASPPVPVLPTSIQIRPMRRGEEARIFALSEEIFQDHWGYVPGDFDEWVHWYCGEGFNPSNWFLALDGPEMVGFALCRLDGDVHNSTAIIDDLGVTRSWRQRGLGLALLHHAFGEFYRRGISRCALSVDSENITGATRLYQRAGMQQAKRMDIRYHKALRGI